ncbi:hypothetical protein LINPERPRIM_LOCUS17953, partial [Linum perenne]
INVTQPLQAEQQQTTTSLLPSSTSPLSDHPSRSKALTTVTSSHSPAATPSASPVPVLQKPHLQRHRRHHQPQVRRRPTGNLLRQLRRHQPGLPGQLPDEFRRLVLQELDCQERTAPLRPCDFGCGAHMDLSKGRE